MSINDQGEIEWVSPKRIQVEGSDSKTITIKSLGGDGLGRATELYIRGNPTKVLQGHNVFGSDNLVSLVLDVFTQIIQPKFKLTPSISELNKIRTGDYPLSLVDINYSYDLPCRSDVNTFIRSLEFKAKTRHGRPSSRGGTLYFGKHSERWALKFYSKGDEITRRKGQLPPRIANQGIEAWADSKLRAEIRLFKKELNNIGIIKASDLTVNRVPMIFSEYLARVDMSNQIKLSDEIELAMPKRLVSTYTLWKEGHHLLNMMSPSTFKRHRKELKDDYGINIDLHPDSIQKTNVVPMIKLLEAKPSDVPEWACSKGLVHHSAKVA